jgi:ERCC4-type nuclease
MKSLVSSPEDVVATTETANETTGCDIFIRSEKSLEPFFKALNHDWRVTVKQIPVDFIIPTDKDTPIAIERKTTSDFIGSIKSNHLVDQLRAMREISDDCYILLEGSWSWIFSEKNKYRSHFNQSSVVGFIDVVDKFGVKIIPVNNKLWSIWWISKKLTDLKGVKKKQTFKLRGSASRDLSPAEQAQYIIEGFPGLGPKGLEEIKHNFIDAQTFIEWILHVGDDWSHITPLAHLDKLSTRISNLRMTWQKILQTAWFSDKSG